MCVECGRDDIIVSSTNHFNIITLDYMKNLKNIAFLETPSNSRILRSGRLCLRASGLLTLWQLMVCLRQLPECWPSKAIPSISLSVCQDVHAKTSALTYATERAAPGTWRQFYARSEQPCDGRCCSCASPWKQLDDLRTFLAWRWFSTLRSQRRSVHSKCFSCQVRLRRLHMRIRTSFVSGIRQSLWCVAWGKKRFGFDWELTSGECFCVRSLWKVHVSSPTLCWDAPFLSAEKTHHQHSSWLNPPRLVLVTPTVPVADRQVHFGASVLLEVHRLWARWLLRSAYSTPVWLTYLFFLPCGKRTFAMTLSHRRALETWSLSFLIPRAVRHVTIRSVCILSCRLWVTCLVCVFVQNMESPALASMFPAPSRGPNDRLEKSYELSFDPCQHVQDCGRSSSNCSCQPQIGAFCKKLHWCNKQSEDNERTIPPLSHRTPSGRVRRGTTKPEADMKVDWPVLPLIKYLHTMSAIASLGVPEESSVVGLAPICSPNLSTTSGPRNDTTQKARAKTRRRNGPGTQEPTQRTGPGKEHQRRRNRSSRPEQVGNRTFLCCSVLGSAPEYRAFWVPAGNSTTTVVFEISGRGTLRSSANRATLEFIEPCLCIWRTALQSALKRATLRRERHIMTIVTALRQLAHEFRTGAKNVDKLQRT